MPIYFIGVQTRPLKIHPFEYIPEIYKPMITKSIRNNVEHKPKLFDGISFHLIDHDNKIKIYDTYFTKKNLILLIETGGGNVVSRPPNLSTVQNKVFQPYHAQNTEDLKFCCNYIIYDEDIEHELKYNMKELRHKSSKWLVDCILQFEVFESYNATS